MSGYVGVDGGQSELRLTVVGSGVVHTGPGFRYGSGSIESSVASAWALAKTSARASAERAASAARASARVSERAASARAAAVGSGAVARAVLGLTGLPSTLEALERLAAAVAETLGAAEVVLCADNVIAHAGALPDGYGVALTVGTGVGCLAADPATGTTHRVDGWGHLYGDDGSAFAIGRAGIAASLRAVDGRGPRTALSRVAEQRYGSLDGMTSRLYHAPDVVDATARFAPDVVVAAGSGDPVAAGIMHAAGVELARTATAAVNALGLRSPRPPVPVALTGRLIEDGGPLVEAFHTTLAAECPRANLVPAAGSSLDGASRMAVGLPDVYRPLLYLYRGR